MVGTTGGGCGLPLPGGGRVQFGVGTRKEEASDLELGVDMQRESGKRLAEDSSESPAKRSSRKNERPVHDGHLACGSSIQCGAKSPSTGRSADPYAGTSARDKLASLRKGEAKGKGAEERARLEEGNMWKGEQHGKHVLEGVDAGEVKDDGGEGDEGQRDIQEVVRARERSNDERVPLEEKKENGLVEHKLMDLPHGLPKLDEIHAAERPKQLHVFLMQHPQAQQPPTPPASAWGAPVGGGPSFASMLASSNTFASMLQTGLAPPANQQPFTIKLAGTNAFSAVLAAGTFSAVLAHGQDVKDNLLRSACKKEDWLSDKKGDDAEGGDNKCAHVKADGHHEQVVTEVLSSQAHNHQAVAQREQQGAIDADGHVQRGSCKEGQVEGRRGENGDEQSEQGPGSGLDDYRSTAAHRGRGQEDGAGARRHAVGADVADQVCLSDVAEVADLGQHDVDSEEPPGEEGVSQHEPPPEESIDHLSHAEPMPVSDDDDHALVDSCAQRTESGNAVDLPGDSLGTCVPVGVGVGVGT